MFSPAPKSRLARIRRHALNVIAVLLTLEVCCRAFVEKHPEMIVRDPELGRRFVADFQETVWNDESQRMIRIETNSLGFRGPEPSLAKADGTKRVVVLGDSLISGFQVEQDETMCARLHSILNQRDPQTHWEVLNFGVTGSGTADQHIRYQQVLRKLNPDLVLVCFGMGTDTVDNHPQMSRSPLVRYDLDESGKLVLIPGSSANAAAANLLNKYSALYLWQKRISNVAIKQFKQNLEYDNNREWIFLEPTPPEIERAWNITAAILETFRNDVIADGGEFCVVTIPTGRMIYDDQFASMIELGHRANTTGKYVQDLPERKLQQICDSRKIRLIRLEQRFRKQALGKRSDIKEECFFYGGNGHMNRRGNSLAAEGIADYVLERNILPHEQSVPSIKPNANLAVRPTNEQRQ